MQRRYDPFWKGVLEEVFDDLLRFVFPHADKELDLEKGFEYLDKELGELYPEPEHPGQVRFVDKLAKVFMRDGSERWVLIHVEVQGHRDTEFARRMFTYYYRIMDRFETRVTAIAIFSGADGKRMPNQFEDIFLGTSLTYRYNTLCITDYADKALELSENPFALVMLVAKKILLKGEDLDALLLKEKLHLVRLLMKKGLFTKPKIAAIFTFLNNYICFEKSETSRIFREQVDIITGKKNTMGILEQVAQVRAAEAKEEGILEGIEKGREEGRAEEQEKSVRIFLAHTEFSPEKIASLVGVSVAFVEKIKEELRLI
jgi:predicted transposase YdaD